MYVRPNFAPADIQAAYSLIQRQRFGLLVSATGDEIVATHLPFVLASTRGAKGTLLGHMAAANPHSKLLQAKRQMLVAFTGPNAYISPSWFRDRASAPTWNYVAVHCYGFPSVAVTEEHTLRIISDLVTTMEEQQAEPWHISELSRNDIERLVRAVVAFEIPIERIEAQFKLSQGEPVANTHDAIARLQWQGQSELAALMRSYALPVHSE